MERLSDEHKIMLYRILIRQDEQGRQPTYLPMKKFEDSQIYQDLIHLDLLAYEVMGKQDKAVVSLMVTLKGSRYCADNLGEFSALEKASRPEVWIPDVS
jgi:hypothetical protein